MAGDPTEDIESFIADGESPVHAIRHRHDGLVNGLMAALFGWRITYWVVTDQRIIEYAREAGGFEYRDVPLEKITSVTYRRRVRLAPLVAGALVAVLGIVVAAGHLVTPQVYLQFFTTAVAVPLLPVGAALAFVGLLGVAVGLAVRSRVVAIHTNGPAASLLLPVSAGEEIHELVRKVNEQRQPRAEPPE